MDSATLKESPLLIGRIAMADHSLNAGPYSTRVRIGEGFARDLEARALSVAAQRARARLQGRRRRPRTNQKSKRK
jgi:hypothetical protein